MALSNFIDRPVSMMIVIVCWISFCIIEGVREGIFFDCFGFQNPSPKESEMEIKARKDIHKIFTYLRIAVFIPAFVFVPWLCGIGLFLIFPFLHDGFLYLTRNKLNVGKYIKGFWSEPSNSSLALINFPLWFRSTMFVVGMALIIISFYK